MTEIMTAGGIDTMPSYPMSILRSCAALDESPAFRHMPDGYLRILFRLLKKIDVKDPGKGIFAQRETLASEAGKSVETVGRALRWLEDEGFITRNQVARKFLRGSDSHIHPTRKLIDELGIGHTSTRASTPAPIPQPAVKSDASLSGVKESINLPKKQSSEPVDNSAFTRVDGKSVPADLAWLVQSGKLSVIALLGLMKMARKTGKLLSDVVTINKKHLERPSLYGNGLYAYLRTLIQQDKDYAWLVLQQKNAVQQAQEQKSQIELLARKAQEWVGRILQERGGEKTYQIAKDGQIETWLKGRCVAASRFSMAFIEAVEDGRLSFVRSMDDKTFAAKECGACGF